MKIAHRKNKYKPPTPKLKPGSIDVLSKDGKIIIQFPEMIRAATFNPDQAIGLAQAIVQMVNQIQQNAK